MNFKAGSIFYSKNIKTTAQKSGASFGLKGHIFGMALGHVAPKDPDPTDKQIIGLLAEAGFCSFDDVLNALGEPATNKVIEYLREKYAKA